MTVTYRYIGKGTTDANGVAHITEDAEGQDISSNPGYTGVGAGKIDVVASVDKPITTGSIQSNTYQIEDCLFYDSGVGSTGDGSWNNYQNRIEVSTDGSGTVLNATGGVGYYMAIKSGESTTKTFGNSFVVEFEVLDYSYLTNCAVGFEDSSEHNYYLNKTGWGISKGSKVKITYDGSTLTFQSDNNTPITETVTINSPMNIYLRISNGNNLKYKNFKIYGY